MGSSLTEKQIEWVCHALSITPIICSIYVSPYDGALAEQLADDRQRAASLEAAHELARWLAKNGHMSVVIGGTNVLDAVYAEGKRECLKAE